MPFAAVVPIGKLLLHVTASPDGEEAFQENVTVELYGVVKTHGTPFAVIIVIDGPTWLEARFKYKLLLSG